MIRVGSLGGQSRKATLLGLFATPYLDRFPRRSGVLAARCAHQPTSAAQVPDPRPPALPQELWQGWRASTLLFRKSSPGGQAVVVV